MALAGPPLAFQPNDQDDVDFFDQLADDLGNEDRLHQNYEQGEGSFDEVFSKLTISGAGPVVAASEIAPENGSGDAVSDEFWLQETGLTNGVVPDTVTVTANPLPGISIAAENLQETDAASPLGTLALPPLGTHYGDPQDDASHQSSVLNLALGEVGIAADRDVPDGALQNVNAEVTTNPSVGSKSLLSDLASHSHHEVTRSQPLIPDIKELQWSSFSEVFTPEEGPDAFSDLLSELDAGTGAISNLSFGVQSGYRFDLSTVAPSSQSEWGVETGSHADEIPADPASLSDHIAGEHLQGVYGPIDEQGMQMQGVYGPINEQGTQHSQVGSTSPADFGYFSIGEQHSCDYGMGNEQGGKGQVNVSDARFRDYSEGVQSQGAYGLLSQQGVQNQLEQSKVVPAESASQDIFTGGGGQLHGGSSMTNGYYEAQQQVVQPESWENMYPGWYFDFASNEWKQIEGWDFNTGSIAVEDWVGGSTDGLLTHFPSSAADALSSQLEKNQTAVTDLTLQTGPGQVSLSAPGYGSEVLEQPTSAGSTWQTRQEGFPLSASEAIKGLEGHGMDVHEQRTSNGGSGSQQQINWEEQYPGWYFDYQSQQWQQIAVNSSQSWVPGQHNNVEGIQVAEDSSHSISSLSIPQGIWVEQQSQPEHQHEINKNMHWPERSESVYKSGGDKASLGQGMPFHAWEASAVTTNANDLVGSDTDKVQEASQFWKDGSGYEFQGYAKGDLQFYNQDETDYTPMKQEIPYGSQTSFNAHYSQQYYQSRNAPGTVTEGLQSSAGRPSHALVAFGFGGKLITMKATSGGIPEAVILRDLNQLVLPANSSDRNDGVSYFSSLNRGGLAGPLIGGVVTTKELLRWVDDRIANCEMEDPYCTSSEALRILWSVLKVACLHYGKLRSMTGSSSLKLQSEDGPEVALGRLFCAAKSQSHWNQGISASPDALQSVPLEDQLQAIALEMKRSLIDGKRNEALQLAQQGQLWGPALVLAWQLGEKAYVETVMKMAQQQFVPGSPLRTLFLLFAGQTTELFTTTQGLPSPAGVGGPYLPGSYNSVKDSAGGMLRDWLGNLSIIAANPTKGDEQVITHLGDCLWKDHGEVAGAHTCYLVADANFESFSESARLCLVGADHFKCQRTFATPTAIQRTELYEYAKVLGNPQFILIPFQPYKLLYAYMLVEAGKISEARRYCQAVTKTLKNAGRGPEVEFCRQSALALEERLRLHSQGGYSLNSATGKLVGKFIGTIDSTIHRIIGGPPQRQASEPSLNKNPRDWYSIGQRMGNSATLTKETSFAPSISKNNLPNANNQQVEAPPRSVSEPNLSWSPLKEKQNSAIGSELASASPKESKSESLAGGYLGRFGSQFLSKAVGFMKPNKKEAKLGDKNKFYYNKELKRWVEEGVEQTMDEIGPPPPPTAASFSSHYGTGSLDVKFSTGTEGHDIFAEGNSSSSAGMPSMPPSLNQFSVRGHLRGVRSRYVDTFNKGGALPEKSTESPIVPNAGWGMIPPSTQFFMPATVATPTSDFTQDFDNGQNNNANPHLLLSASSTTKNGQVHAEDEALLPKNLSSSFNAVPSMHKHSSISNVTAYENNNVALTEGMGGFMPENGHSSGNTARDVSWIGNSPSAYASKSVTNLSARPATHRPVLPNVSKVKPENILAGMKADEYMHPTARVFNTSLPSPPAIEPPMSYMGAESSLSEKREGHIQSGMLNSVQGGIYSDLQEVEL